MTAPRTSISIDSCNEDYESDYDQTLITYHNLPPEVSQPSQRSDMKEGSSGLSEKKPKRAYRRKKEETINTGSHTETSSKKLGRPRKTAPKEETNKVIEAVLSPVVSVPVKESPKQEVTNIPSPYQVDLTLYRILQQKDEEISRLRNDLRLELHRHLQEREEYDRMMRSVQFERDGFMAHIEMYRKQVEQYEHLLRQLAIRLESLPK